MPIDSRAFCRLVLVFLMWCEASQCGSISLRRTHPPYYGISLACDDVRRFVALQGRRARIWRHAGRRIRLPSSFSAFQSSVSSTTSQAAYTEDGVGKVTASLGPPQVARFTTCQDFRTVTGLNERLTNVRESP